MQIRVVLLLWCMLTSPSELSAQQSAPITLMSSVQDRREIEVLLSTYTRAVSTKDEGLFESILLNTQIPFSYVSGSNDLPANIRTGNYEAFRKAVFEGRPFEQTFNDVSIEQDSNLANVRLVFVNRDGKSSTSGWKTLQLLKVNGDWKIASEFYTVH